MTITERFPALLFHGFLLLAGWPDPGQRRFTRGQAHDVAARLRGALDDVLDVEVPSMPGSPPAELFSGQRDMVVWFARILERTAGLEIVDSLFDGNGYEHLTLKFFVER